MNDQRYKETHQDRSFEMDKLKPKLRLLQGRMQMTVICDADPEGQQLYIEDEIDQTLLETEIDRSSNALDPEQLNRKMTHLKKTYEDNKQDMGKYVVETSAASPPAASEDEVMAAEEEPADDSEGDSDGEDICDMAPDDPRALLAEGTASAASAAPKAATKAASKAHQQRREARRAVPPVG